MQTSTTTPTGYSPVVGLSLVAYNKKFALGVLAYIAQSLAGILTAQLGVASCEVGACIPADAVLTLVLCMAW